MSDKAVPTVISPSVQGSGYFVLNQDLSLLTHSSLDSSLNGTCAAPSGFSTTSTTPRTFLNDTRDAYFTAASSTSANSAVSGFSFINTGLCQAINGPVIAGGTPTYTFSSNDTFHGRFFVLSGFNGNGPDTLTVEVNLNNALSGGNYVTQLATVPLDTGAQYTSLVTDTSGGASGISLTAITELKTATSPGNLWIYNQKSGAAYKILGPGGVPLPAVGSFLIPAQTNGGGALLVLINQDNLTATNLSNPPQDTTPFTIIDLGQLIQTFSIQTTGGTITLPFVTQLSATTPYFAMLGAAYNPANRLVYAVVGGGSQTGVTGSVISYDPFHPGSPNETVVGDVSNVPFSYGTYPQLALSAAAGTLQILTSNPSGLYSVGITGTGNTAVAVTGSVFPDTNFQPTFIAANPLVGETYIASASGQVDVVTNTSTKPLATFTLNGPDIATTTQSYSLQATALSATVDTALIAAPVTITATPPYPGTPFTVAAGTFGNFGLNPSNIAITFPALGVYTLVASIPATANYPAITSNPVNVTVASNFIAGVYPTTLSITAPDKSTTTAVNVLVNLGGSTYAPTGHIDVKDGTGKIVGTTTFNGGALVQPTTVATTLTQGPNTLTASYSGDAQNAPTTSPSQQISVGTTVTPTLALSNVGPTVVAATSNAGTVTFGSSTSTVPTGTVTIYYVPSGSTAQTVLTNVPAAGAFASGGIGFTYASPPNPGNYTLYATYPGDSNYSAVTSAGSSLSVLVAIATTTTVTAPATATTNGIFSVNIKLASATSTQTPSGTLNVFAKLAGSSTSTNIGIVNANQAYATGGNSFNATLPTAGVWTITASFYGDAYFTPSSGAATVTVNPSTTVATTLKIAAPANVATNTPYTVVVALTAASTLTNGPSGLVTLVVTSPSGAVVSTINTTAASAFLGSGYTASIPAATASGTYTLTASYAGDSNYAASSTSSAVTIGNSLSTTAIGISGPTNVTQNVPSNITIKLIPQNGVTAIPTGNIVITSVNPSGVTATLGTITAAQALASGGDVATINYSLLGNFTVTATYAGDANFSGSSGSLVITVGGATPTTLGISAPSNITVGTSFITTLTLKATGSTSAAITGNVSVMATGYGGGGVYSLGTVSASSALAAGGVQFTSSIPAAGTYTLAAVYAGDANYATSGGSALVTVAAAPTVTTAQSYLPNVTVGTAVLTNIKLSSTAKGSPVPTGTVVVTSTLAGVATSTATLSAADAFTGTQSTFTPTKAGSYTVTARYSGDANYFSSTGTLNITVSALPTPGVGLTNPLQGLVATPLTVSVQLVDSTGKKISSTGLITVTSTINGVNGPSAVLDSTGTGTLTFATPGQYVLVATFAGDANYGPASSTAFGNFNFVNIYTQATLPTFTLQPRDPSLSLAGPIVQLTPDNITEAFILTPVNGYTGSPVITTAERSLANAGPNQSVIDLLSITSILGNPLDTTIFDGRGQTIGYQSAFVPVGAPNTPFSIEFFYGQLLTGQMRAQHQPGPILCALWGAILLAGLHRRMRIHRMARLLCLLVVGACAASMLSGCANIPQKYLVTVTATDAQLGITQSTSFEINLTAN